MHLLSQARTSAAVVAATAALVALIVRLVDLGGTLLWVDEAYSVHLARLDVLTLLGKLVRESTPPLYYVLLGGWVRVFGESAAAVRALSVLFGLLTVLLLYVVARRHLAPPAPALAVWLLALSPLHVYYSQQARMYALVSLLAVAAAGFALAYREARSTRALAGFAATCFALLLSHNVCLWIVIGFAAALAFGPRERRGGYDLLAALSIVLIAYLPWLNVLAKQVGRQSTVLDWFVPLWEAKSPILHVGDTIWSFSFGPYPVYLALASGPAGSWPVRAFVLALLALGIWRTRGVPAARFLGAGCALALACALLYSYLAQPVYIPGRTDMALLPFFSIFLALGLAVLPTPVLRLLAAVCLGALALAVLVPYYRDPTRDASRAYLESIRERARPGDLLITTGLTFAEAEYAARRFALPVTIDSFPRVAREHPGYISWSEMEADPESLARDARAIAEEAAATAARGGRVFVLWITHPANEPLLTELARTLELLADSGEAYRQSITNKVVRVLEWGHAQRR